MGSHIFHFLILFLFMVSAVARPDRSSCQESCGNIPVLYPFGIGNPECFKDPSFNLTCNTSVSPPQLFTGNIQIFNLSLEEGTAIVQLFASFKCYNDSKVSSEYDHSVDLEGSPYLFSTTQNQLRVLGCDTLGVFTEHFFTGCVSTCNNDFTLINDPANLTEEVQSCSGIGCCQTQIPPGVSSVNISLGSLFNHSYFPDSSMCDFGFVHRTNSTFKRTSDYVYYSETVLDWAVRNMTCEEAQTSQEPNAYICSDHTRCQNSSNGPGYHCVCKDGFQGNPYIIPGCKDIDECLPQYHDTNPCHGTCKNTEGNYTCHCSFWYHGDGKVGCSLKTFTKVMIVIGGCVLLATTILFGLVLGWISKKRNQESNIKKNGGLLLAQLSVKSFKETQLAKATNNYDAKKLLGEGGNGWVYRGSLDGITQIAVKKSKVVDQNRIVQFLNEADIVSKINHKNVVKLLGVCLDSKVPMLVYEFVSNGTLYHHLHGKGSRILDSWRICLRIAAETARALDYMHSLAYPPIIHRDVKTRNILLDGAYVAKVADFGASKLVHLDRSMEATEGQGTMGYLDPEYLQTGDLTTMSDVYSFGVVLMEILSKQKPISRGLSGERISLVKIFQSAINNNNMNQVVKVADVTEEETEQVHLVADLAIKCVALPSNKRPTMTEVADVLNAMSKVYSTFPIEGSGNEMVNLLDDQEVMTTSVHFELEDSGNV